MRRRDWRDIVDDAVLVICLVLFIVNVWIKDYVHAQLFLTLMVLVVLGGMRSEQRRQRSLPPSDRKLRRAPDPGDHR